MSKEPGPVHIELFPAPPEAQAPAEGPALGYVHLAFTVEDLDAKIAALREDGYAMGEIVDCSNVHPGMRVCFFQDKEGNTIELMENYADQENPPQDH